jgi:hypothetical protein
VAVLVEAGGVVLVLLCCVLVDDAVLIETVGAGCTCTAALEITAQLGIESIDSCALMLATVSAAAVVLACVDPLNCSMVRLTVEVGANNLLAAVCWMVRRILQFWHCTEERAGLSHVPQLERMAKALTIFSSCEFTAALDRGSETSIDTT